jgi:hypothetical protein
VAGIVFFAVLGGVLWGISAWISGTGTQVRLGDSRFEVGRVDRVADQIAVSGPLLYPDLKDSDGTRSIVVDHVGETDNRGWTVYRPFPGDDPESTCLAAQIPQTRQFEDCAGRVLDVAELQVAPDVRVIIENGEILSLEFASAVVG